MAEFKKLSEVDLLDTTSDNATVLVEEGGEIKRVPKSEVGGAGGYIATLTEEDYNNPVVEWTGPVISANYDELYDVLCAGGSAWIDMTAMMDSGAPSALAASASVVSPTAYEKMRVSIISWLITDIGLIAKIPGDMQVLFPNGSHNLDPVISDE